MASKISREERLLNLTAVLLDSPRPLTREDLKERVDGYPEDSNSFRRAFERDKETLREVGIPLAVVDIPYTNNEQGYRIPPEEYYLQGAEFTPAELAALHVATMAVQFGNSDEEALWKLGGVGLTDVNSSEVNAMFASPISELPSDAALLEVFSRVQEKKPLSFTYRSSTGEEKRREVEPWSLYFQRGRWYLTAFDRTAQGERQFRLDRMSSVEALDGTNSMPVAERSGPVVLRPWEIGTSDPLMVEVFVKSSSAVAFGNRVGTEAGSSRAVNGVDGQVFTLSVRALDAMVAFVLEWLDDAVVLGPPQARTEMVKALKAWAGTAA